MKSSFLRWPEAVIQALLKLADWIAAEYHCDFGISICSRHENGVQVEDEELSVEEAKERKIMKMLLKVKNGTPPQRKSALRQLTDKARDFGAGPLFNQILPLLMAPTLEDQERHLLVKVSPYFCVWRSLLCQESVWILSCSSPPLLVKLLSPTSILIISLIARYKNAKSIYLLQYRTSVHIFNTVKFVSLNLSATS